MITMTGELSILLLTAAIISGCKTTITNPGLGVRPDNNNNNEDTPLFVLVDGDSMAAPSQREGEGGVRNADYAARMVKFLQVQGYDTRTMKPNRQFDLDSLGPCSRFPYGYVSDGRQERIQPCIFLKLNPVLDWRPEPYECTWENRCPHSLKNHLDSEAGQNVGNNNVWVDCQGLNAADREALEGRIEYFPASRSFPFHYFPYVGEERNSAGEIVGAYHPPLVAIRVDPPRVPGQIVTIQCRAYYRGVKFDSTTKEGLVQFGLQILPKCGAALVI